MDIQDNIRSNKYLLAVKTSTEEHLRRGTYMICRPMKLKIPAEPNSFWRMKINELDNCNIFMLTLVPSYLNRPEEANSMSTFFNQFHTYTECTRSKGNSIFFGFLPEKRLVRFHINITKSSLLT